MLIEVNITWRDRQGGAGETAQQSRAHTVLPED